MVTTNSLEANALERAPFVAGPVRALLRIEGLAVFVASIAAYATTGRGFGLFAALVLWPDLALLGYLAGPRIGAAAYNTTHSYVGPMIIAGLAFAGILPTTALPYVLIWTAHVGIDRALGYGLKYPTAFGHTHLGWLGKAKAALVASRGAGA
ncbi:MAG: DUF4260 domain-containing protein [Polyangiaceae bacterium]|nr:DUF4260 domain-containing protein [Polyangiaceae bacterium]